MLAIVEDQLREAAQFLRACRGSEPWDLFEAHAASCEIAVARLEELTARAARLEEENALYREYYEASEAFADRKMTTIEQMEVMKRFRAAESALRATLNPAGGEHADD